MSEQLHIGTPRSIALRSAAVMTLGRATDNDVVVDDNTVSRHHARLERSVTPGEWTVTDLGSSNGTFVNGLRINSRTKVRAGDRIQLGSCSVVLADHDPLADVLIGHTQLADDANPHGLSQREREILRLLAAGMTDRQIADHVTLSIRTVQSHLDRIRDKTGLRRRAELTRLALDSGVR